MASSGLPYQPASPRIVMSVEAYPIHHVTVETADRIDKALPGWIREAYVFRKASGKLWLGIIGRMGEQSA